jgi:hypothetical protein
VFPALRRVLAASMTWVLRPSAPTTGVRSGTMGMTSKRVPSAKNCPLKGTIPSAARASEVYGAAMAFPVSSTSAAIFATPRTSTLGSGLTSAK